MTDPSLPDLHMSGSPLSSSPFSSFQPKSGSDGRRQRPFSSSSAVSCDILRATYSASPMSIERAFSCLQSALNSACYASHMKLQHITYTW